VRPVAAALLHHPVLDRQGQIVTTAITNLDLHDIARSAYTFGLDALFIAHPIKAQRELAERVQEHWINGTGARRIPDRTPPMRLLRVVASLDDCIVALGGPSEVELWTTSAQRCERTLAHDAARARARDAGRSLLLVFGTGWGLAPDVQARADAQLAPVESPRDDGYNHLSVRSAAAIIFDRLLVRT
jgi:hypothetical protein